MVNYFFFNNKSSLDFGVFISGESTWRKPNKRVEKFSVPGKDGTLSISDGTYENIEIPYNCSIIEDFTTNFDALSAFLMSTEGYKRFEDTYHPNYYRLARFDGAIEAEMTQLNRHGTFELLFDFDPRQFLIDGDTFNEISTGINIYNSYLFTAKPTIRAYGTGTITVGGISVVVNSASGYTDLDSELQEAYKGSTNCNGNITLTNGEYPVLKPGNNTITFSGFTKVEIKTHFWTI